MLRYSSYFGAVVLLLSLSTHATAADTGFHVFASIGHTNSEIELGGPNEVNDNDISYTLGAGYAFNPFFALQGAYDEFTTHDGETDCPPGFACLVVPLQAKADVTGLSLAFVGSFPLNDKLDVYGKLGFMSWDIDFDGISDAFDDSGEDLLYGLGLRWSPYDHWEIFSEFRRVDLDVDTVSIGLKYNF